MAIITTNYTLRHPVIGAKIALQTALSGYVLTNGFPTSPPPVYPPTSTAASLRITCGSHWWEIRETLTVQWTLHDSVYRPTYSNTAYYFTGVVVSHVITETSSDTLDGLAPNAIVTPHNYLTFFSFPDGETLTVTQNHVAIDGHAANGYVDWTDFQMTFIGPARLFPFTGNFSLSADDNGGVEVQTATAPEATLNTTDFGRITVDPGHRLNVFSPVLYSSAPLYFGLNGDQIVSALWDWGDGTTTTETPPFSTSSNPLLHEYQNDGTYLVTLTVTDDWGMSATATQSFTPTVQSKRIISFACDGLGFLVRARQTASPQTLLTERHDGRAGAAWEQLNATATLQAAALSKPLDLSRLFRIAQRVTEKDWQIHFSDDLGSTWSPNAMSTPFDSTYKATTRVASGLGVLLCLGLDFSSTWVGRVSFDGGLNWTSTAGAIGTGSKWGDLEYDANNGRFILVADNLSKVTSDTGATAWTNL